MKSSTTVSSVVPELLIPLYKRNRFDRLLVMFHEQGFSNDKIRELLEDSLKLHKCSTEQIENYINERISTYKR